MKVICRPKIRRSGAYWRTRLYCPPELFWEPGNFEDRVLCLMAGAVFTIISIVSSILFYFWDEYTLLQLQSFETELSVPMLAEKEGGSDTCRGVFIRAPAILDVGSNVEVLADCPVPSDRPSITIASGEGVEVCLLPLLKIPTLFCKWSWHMLSFSKSGILLLKLDRIYGWAWWTVISVHAMFIVVQAALASIMFVWPFHYLFSLNL